MNECVVPCGVVNVLQAVIIKEWFDRKWLTKEYNSVFPFFFSEYVDLWQNLILRQQCWRMNCLYKSYALLSFFLKIFFPFCSVNFYNNLFVHGVNLQSSYNNVCILFTLQTEHLLEGSTYIPVTTLSKWHISTSLPTFLLLWRSSRFLVSVSHNALNGGQ
jgi:hypothetical protein